MTPSALCSLLGSLLPALTLTDHEGCGCDERECVAARRARRTARLAVVNALAELSGEVVKPCDGVPLVPLDDRLLEIASIVNDFHNSEHADPGAAALRAMDGVSMALGDPFETTTCRAEDVYPPTSAFRFQAMYGSAFDTEPSPLLALCSCGDPLCDDRCGKAAP